MKRRLKVLIISGFLCLISTYGIGMPSDNTNYVDISVTEAWELLSDTSNGIQIPIDVRTGVEWDSSRIDTPFPEFPRHFEKDDILDEETYQLFTNQFNGSEIVVYCKSGGRSASAASVITSRGFNGTVYNILGGITDWKSANLPVKEGNDAPEKPQIPEGPSICNIDTLYTFSSITDDSNDDVLRLGWDWNNDDFIDEWTDYQPSGSIFERNYTFNQNKIHQIRVVAEDLVGYQSDFSSPLEIEVNTPPTITSFDGPQEGKIGEEYDFVIKGVDEEDDILFYKINWDGTEFETFGPYDSGATINISHTWQEKGTYTINIIMFDEHDAQSDEYSHSLNMPKYGGYKPYIEFRNSFNLIIRLILKELACLPISV